MMTTPTTTPETPAPATPAPVATPPAPAAPAEWLASLPEDLRQHPSMAKFTSGEALARSYINVERLIGAEKIALPSGPDDSEGHTRIHVALGRPETADGYEYKPPEKLPEGVQFDEGLLKAFQAQAHKEGLNQAQFGGVAGMFLDFVTQSAAAAKSAHDNALSEADGLMKREWGERYDTNLSVAREAMRKFGGDDLVNHLNISGLGNHPALIRAFAKIGAEVVGEQALIGEKRDGAMTPANLDQAISEFRAKNQGPLYDRMHPDHDRLVQELHKLYERRFPETAI